MTPERWLQIKELFYAALDVPVGERAAFLARECGSDFSLKAELEKILDAHERTGPFLEESAAVMAPPWIGRRVGPYQLIELLGTGGMGEVYKAVRADEQFQQEVAIKLVRGGYDTKQILERFRAERQILATLSHANIARLLDGGATDEGMPYLAMELIEGERIDAYCQRLALPVRERIRLFRDVCAAVSYAHQHLVVHCDLKPGNIFVTADGTVKLLDFGVAKLLSQAPRETHEHRTVTVMRAWTPEFASPEQVRGEGTSTSTDVYSLGVVLYWLLAGRSPYRSGTLPHEIIRDVCDTEPERPSTATRDSVELRGDLDVIVMKALRKEPARRYSSVEQFSEDLRRYLAGLPVTARGDRFTYRARKFITRNKVGVTAGLLLFVSLVGGLATTLWQARIASAETARAARHFASVRVLANSFMFEMHDAIRNLPGSTAARQLLVRNALQYLDELSSESVDDAGLHAELATAYVKVGDIQGEYGQQNLGEVAAALKSYGKAVYLLERLARADPANNRLGIDLSNAYRKLGTASYNNGDAAGASSATEKAVTLAEALSARAPGDAVLLATLATAYGDRCKILAYVGNAPASSKSCLEAIEIQERLVRASPADRAAKRTLSALYDRAGSVLGIAAATKADRESVLTLHRQALDVAIELAAADPNDTVAQSAVAVDYNGVGEALLDLDEVRPAIDAYANSRRIFDDMIAKDPQNVEIRYDNAQVMNNLANGLRLDGEKEEALRILEEAMTLAESLPGRDTNALYQAGEATIGVRLAHAHAALGQWAQAQARYEKGRLIYADLQKRGVLQAEDVHYFDEAVAGLVRCKSELARLAAHAAR
jgi:tetratricopeptide (TPR) repeat protein